MGGESEEQVYVSLCWKCFELDKKDVMETDEEAKNLG